MFFNTSFQSAVEQFKNYNGNPPVLDTEINPGLHSDAMNFARKFRNDYEQERNANGNGKTILGSSIDTYTFDTSLPYEEAVKTIQVK